MLINVAFLIMCNVMRRFFYINFNVFQLNIYVFLFGSVVVISHAWGTCVGILFFAVCVNNTDLYMSMNRQGATVRKNTRTPGVLFGHCALCCLCN